MESIKPELNINLEEEPISYPIYIDRNILVNLPQIMAEKYQGEKIFLVTDDNVDELYGDRLRKLLSDRYEIHTYVVPAGEKAKSFNYLKWGYDQLAVNNFHRDHLVLALGGGVVGDLAGYLAASYMRGISLVQVPTTLLAQVDSSVGGKTAINHKSGKNMIGAFYQPDLVFIDTNFLTTLPERELKTGLAEVIKHGLIADRELFQFLEENRSTIFQLEPKALAHIICRSCALKAEIVIRDQKEQGERALLNFGHTFGHALEKVSGYGSFTHGEAVAVGMKGEARLSCQRGSLAERDLKRIETVLNEYQLKESIPKKIGSKELYQALWSDKKVAQETITWIELKKIGLAQITRGMDREKVLKLLEGLK